MKFVIQRVKEATVTIDNQVHCSIGNGLLVFLCLEQGDSSKKIPALVKRLSKLRIFEDENQKMNLNINQVEGELLLISQFTLSWSGDSGHRPSFTKSMPPMEAKLLLGQCIKALDQEIKTVKSGVFGADMKVQLLNDGPVTFHFSL